MFKEFSYLVKLLFHNKPKDCKDLEIIKMKYFPFSGYLAMSWCGKLITRKPDRINKETVNHETTHLKQAQQYSSWLAFYFVYLIEWLKGNPFKTPYKSAYYTIPFEAEAYANEYRDDYNTKYNPKLLKEKYTFKRRKELFKNFKNVSAWLDYLRNL